MEMLPDPLEIQIKLRPVYYYIKFYERPERCCVLYLNMISLNYITILTTAKVIKYGTDYSNWGDGIIYYKVSLYLQG